MAIAETVLFLAINIVIGLVTIAMAEMLYSIVDRIEQYKKGRKKDGGRKDE